jgi:hypothetical protein
LHFCAGAGSKPTTEDDDLLQLALDREVSGDDKKKVAAAAAPKAESKHKLAESKETKESKAQDGKQEAPAKADTEYKGVYAAIPRVKATDMKMHEFIAAGVRCTAARSTCSAAAVLAETDCDHGQPAR